MTITAQFKEQFESAIAHLREEIKNLRTGRATPAIVEDVTVVAYGGKQPLKALASISVTDAKTLTVEPWDKSILKDVEQAIGTSDLGINPINDGKLLRLPLPDLTQDRRQELIKVLHRKLEDGRIAVRQIREDARKEIDTAEKNKTIGEDEKFTQQETLEKMVKEHNETIKKIGDDKEREITTV